MADNISGILKNSSLISIGNRSHSLSNQELIDISQNDDVLEFKVILIGSTSVGKTAIFHKFITGEFLNNNKSTVIAEFHTKYLKVKNNLFVKLILWDTCGSEKFRSITNQYYKGAKAIILVFDLTDQKSFDDLKNIWLKDIKNYADKNIQILIVGNKVDLIEERKVTESQVINFCREKDYKYIDASAKEGTNILKIFEELSFVLATNYEKEREEEMKNQFMMENFDDKNIGVMKNKKFGCC